MVLVFSLGAWRKLIFLILPSIVFWWVWTDRSNIASQIAELESQLKFTSNNAESLGAQLKVINAHKERIERMLEVERKTHSMTINDLTARLDHSKEECARLKTQCGKVTTGTTQINNEKSRPHRDKQNNGAMGAPNGPTGIHAVQSSSGIEEAQQRYMNKPELEAVPEEKEMTPNATAATTLHPYMGENSVHFHRNQPVGANLEFRRLKGHVSVKEIEQVGHVRGEETSNTGLLSAKQRLLKARKHLSTKEAERGAEQEEDIIDYRHDAQPDKNEDDYRFHLGE